MRRPVKINHVELHRWVGLTSLEMEHSRAEACFTATDHQRAATGHTSMLTFGYGYCFPLGYVMPVNRGKAMLGTRLSLRTRKANLSPSGDHQWATWVWRISSVGRNREKRRKPL